MATYEHLPIFRKMLELAVYLEDVVSRFSRYHKNTLGSELRGMCHEALGVMAEANQVKKRREVLLRFEVGLVDYRWSLAEELRDRVYRARGGSLLRQRGNSRFS